MIYAEAMTVAMNYAETHLRELVDALDQGDEVIIERDGGGKRLRLVASDSLQSLHLANLKRGDRVFGRGAAAGAPSQEEWKAMSEEVQRDFDESNAKSAKCYSDIRRS